MVLPEIHGRCARCALQFLLSASVPSWIAFPVSAAKAAVGSSVSNMQHSSRILSIRFFHWHFLLLFVSGVLVRPVFSPVFSVSEPEAQRGDRRRRGKGDDGHQHIAARVLPQQHCAEAAPCGGLPRSDKCVCRLHQHREQQHTRCGEAYCLVPLPSAVFPHTLLDECDPSFRYRTYRLNLLSGFFEMRH